MKKYKCFLSLLLTLCMVLGMIPGTALAVESAPPLSGTCGGEGDGSNLTWEIDLEDKSLTISGQGAMADYELMTTESGQYGDFSTAPWFWYSWDYYYDSFAGLDKVIIGEEVTYIGDFAFFDDNSRSPMLSFYFYGNAPEIGAGIHEGYYDYTDENTGEYVHEEPVFYYIEGKTGWTNSEAYNAQEGTWHWYKLEKWGDSEEGKDHIVSDIHVGDFLTLGIFNNIPMLWQVVGIEDGMLKLFCGSSILNGPIDADIGMHVISSSLSSTQVEGNTNWHTSDIRTYLNSNSATVNYKEKIPNYGSLPGFLTNFTENEAGVLQEITHKSLVHYSIDGIDKDGGQNFATDDFFERNFFTFDMDVYSSFAYKNTTEKMFLPDMLDLREAEENGINIYWQYIYSPDTETFYQTTGGSGYFTRTPVIVSISSLTQATYCGVYYMHTYFGTSTAEAERGIRPMCYIKPDAEQRLNGQGTLESPYTIDLFESSGGNEEPEKPSGDTDDGKAWLTLSPGFGGGNCYKYEFSYSDDYFSGSAYDYSDDLAALSLGLAYAGYSYDCAEDGHGARSLDYGIKEALVTQMGFEESSFVSDSYVYQENGLRGDRNSVASAFAVKMLETEEPLIAVVVRGGGYDGEWDGNFEMGKTVLCEGYEFHKNFFDSAMEVVYRLNTYVGSLEGKYDLSNAKVWVCGYSRGAAIANVVAHFVRLRQCESNTACYYFQNLGFDEEHIFGYTFATPAPVRQDLAPGAPNRIDPYIHNLIGYSDFVPMVVMDDWGYTRFGKTIPLPSKALSPKTYADYIGPMQTIYETVMEQSGRGNSDYASYTPIDNRHDALDGILGFLAEIIGDTDTFTELYQEIIIDLVGSCGLYQKDPAAMDAALNDLESVAWEEELVQVVVKAIMSAIRNLNDVEGKALEHLIAKGLAGSLKVSVNGRNPVKDYIKASVVAAIKNSIGDLDVSQIDLGQVSLDDLEGSLYQVVLQLVEANCANGYYFRMLLGSKYIKVYMELDKEAFAEHIVLAIKDLLHIKSLDGITANLVQEHFPEVYLAWITSMAEADWTFSGSKIVRVECPTDVYVYDAEGTLLVSIVDNEVIGDYLYATTNLLNEKTIYIPTDEEVSIRIIATDDGTMNISATEYDSDGICCRQVFYTDLALESGAEFEMAIAPDLSGEVSLASGDTRIDAAGDTTGEDSQAAVEIVIDGEGSALGGGTYLKGDKARLLAMAKTGWQFDGWYANGEKITDETGYEFSVTADVGLTAKFTEVPVYYDAENNTVIARDVQAGTCLVAALYQGDRICGCAAASADSAGSVSISLPVSEKAEYIKVFRMDSSLSPAADTVLLDFS